MALTIHINHSSEDSPLLTSGVDWVQVDSDNDSIIMSAGSDSVIDGGATPGETALNGAGVVLTGVETVFPFYFLNDISAVVLKEIFLMGEGNYRYVMAFAFDASTVSEPVLEAWDDSDLDTVASVILGEGTPAFSWLKGVVTTDGLPGVSWSGVPLAGSSDGNFLNLNDEAGALSGAKTLYCQLKGVIPASQSDAGASTPVIVVKWTTI